MMAMLLLTFLSAAPKPCVESYEMDAGDAAPCDGSLIPDADLDACHAAEDARDQLKIDLRRKGIDLEQAEKDAAAADAAARAKLAACQDGWDACAARVEVPAVVVHEVPAPWPARTWMIPVWVATGALLAVVVVYATR